LCICATPKHGDGNFTCIPASSFSGFFTGALDLTKHVFNDEGYSVWFEQHRATFADIDNQRQICDTWDNNPLISIVTVVYNTPIPYLHALIDSLKAQSYAHFEVVFVNVSNDDGTVERELESINDKRFRIMQKIKASPTTRMQESSRPKATTSLLWTTTMSLSRIRCINICASSGTTLTAMCCTAMKTSWMSRVITGSRYSSPLSTLIC
jgi:cellulose synthase/poly-beta-1,6-N-acetylglucosamine synthase-like glycosyltransferase